MNNFRNTLRLKTSELSSFPIKEGQTYFDTERGILYRDQNGQRFAVTEVLKVDNLNFSEYTTNQKRILNSIIINKNTVENTYETYYAKDDGTVVLLGSSEGGGVIYSAGEGISISSENEISVNDTILRKQTEN